MDTLREKWLHNRYESQGHPNSKLTKRDRFGNHTPASEHWTQTIFAYYKLALWLFETFVLDLRSLKMFFFPF